MKLTCRNNSCPSLTLKPKFTRDGHYFRASDSKFIQRYKCSHCGKRTSTAQLSPCHGQNRRDINHQIELLVCSKVSYRRIALILRVDKKTVHRKVKFLGVQARKFNHAFLKNFYKERAKRVEFDDLITKERTKMLPVTICAVVDSDSRHILSLEAGRIPAFGHLAKTSRQRYGYRRSEMKDTLKRVFKRVEGLVDARAHIKSDSHKLYQDYVKSTFPQAHYEQFKSLRACVAAQGEMKKTKFDPIFTINHTFAMMRDNINRLVRSSWCVTQDISMLQHHLEIYIKIHNTKLVRPKK